VLRSKPNARAKTNQVLRKLKFIGGQKSFFSGGFGKFIFFIHFGSGFQFVGFPNLVLSFQFLFCHWSRFWLISACDYLAFLLVKSIWQRFFSSALFVVDFVGSQNRRIFFGKGFGKSSLQLVSKSLNLISFWSVKVGFWLFGVLAKYGFYSASESLNRFCFGWSKFLIVWRFYKSCFLSVAKD